MNILAMYDIADPKRLKKVEKIMNPNYAVRGAKKAPQLRKCFTIL